MGPEPCLALANSCVKQRENESSYSNHTAPHRVYRNWLSSIMNMAEKAQFKLDEILPEAAQIETDGTHNWILSFKKASAQHGSYR
jgi:hypothetical protein